MSRGFLMTIKSTIFSRIDYAFAIFIILAVFAFPQYSLGYNPVETVFALDSSYSDSLRSYSANAGLIRATETDAVITPTFIAQSSLMAYNAPPEEGHLVAWTMWVPVTAYSSTPDQTWGDPFITASGERVRDGIIAANFLPMHTQVRLPTLYGDKIFVVKDRMNSRYFYRADIWMPTRWQALQFGLKNIPVEILY